MAARDPKKEIVQGIDLRGVEVSVPKNLVHSKEVRGLLRLFEGRSCQAIAEEIRALGVAPVIETESLDSQDAHLKSCLAVQLVELRREAKESNPILEEDSTIIDVDVQDAFMSGGGLPLDYGRNVLDRIATDNSRKQRRFANRVSTTDLHTRGRSVTGKETQNISMARRHHLPLFSNLSLDHANDVQVDFFTEAGPQRASYAKLRENDDSREVSSELLKLKEYLSEVNAYRHLVALLLNTEVSGNSQTLWPDHAESASEKSLTGGSIRDVLSIIKGGDLDDDSYGGFANNSGQPTRAWGESAILKVAQRIANNESKTQREQYVILRGLATTHCVFFTAENIRVAQEIAKLVSRLKTPAERKAWLASKASIKLKASPDLINRMAAKLESLIEQKFMFDPRVKLAVIWEHTDPVRVPAYDPVEVMAQYEAMGVRVITNQMLVGNQGVR